MPKPKLTMGWRKVLLATAGVATVTAPLLVGTFSAPRLRAQTAQGPTPAFEAASIRPNKTGNGAAWMDPQAGGRLTATNATVALMTRFAYDLPDFQVFGGPKWLYSDRFDVVATAGSDVPLEQKRLMLRRLLADRFKLTVHTEKRELPIYALVMARSDGKLGSRLRQSETDCGRAEAVALPGVVGPSPPDGPPRCGFFGFSPDTNFRLGRGGVAFRGLTMPALANLLVPTLRRPVMDHTGLTGYFDAEFDFIAELPIPPPPPGLPPPAFDAPFVSIFTVFPEQLGLKLDARRELVEVLVIDGAEPPAPE